MKKPTTGFKIIASLVLAFILIAGGRPLLDHRNFKVEIVCGPGVTAIRKLSDFCPSLKGTMADTLVFILEGQQPGGQALIMGNTHANEPEGMISTLIFIENAVVEKGILYLIPFFNRSARLNTRPGEGYPLYFSITTPWGIKKFPMGNRDASPLD